MDPASHFQHIPDQIPTRLAISDIVSRVADFAARRVGRVVIVGARMAISGATVAHMTSLAMFYLLESDENLTSRHDNPNQDTIQALEALSGILGGIAGGIATLIASDTFNSSGLNNYRLCLVVCAALYDLFVAMCGAIVAIGTGTSEMQAGNVGGVTAVGLPLMLIYMRRQYHRGNDGTADNVLISA